MSFRWLVSKGCSTRGLAVAVAASFTLGGTLSAGQDPPREQPTFRSGVQLIEVDVRVFDRGGTFVTDLTRDDFVVLENGRPQKLQALYLVGAGGRAPAPTAAPTPADPAALLPGGTGASPEAPQTWIFVFDLNHLTPGNGFDRARKAVEDYIRDRFKDGDLGGIVAGDKMVNNRLTSVRAELLEAMKSIKPRDDSRGRAVELTREWPRLLDEEEAIRIARNEPEAVQRATQRAATDDPAQAQVADMAVMEKGRRLAGEIHRATLATLGAVNALANGLARVPGPKTVVLLTNGFVVQDIETTLRSVVGQTARSGARVYAIDVRGLNRGGSNLDQAYATDEAGAVPKFETVVDGPNSLAVDTGGMFIRNENNIGRALQRIADDAGRYYVLAYQPESTTWDGKYRPIEVQVKRDGVRVRARKGYLAFEPARMLRPQPLTAPAPGPAPVAPSPVDAPPTTALTSPPIDPATARPESPAPVTAGTIVTTPSSDVTGTVRLRPDPEARVKALSSRETSVAGAADLAERGWQAYERGDIETAFSAFSDAAAHPDVRPWVLYALGMTQTALNKPADAIASWERVRSAVPDFEPVYMDLADTYAHLGNLTQALAVVREAEKRWPQSADVHSAIGVIHVRRGVLDEGIRALERAASLNTMDALAHLNVARAYALRFNQGRRYVTSQRRWVAPEGDRQKALEAFKRCVDLGGPYARQAAEEMSILEWAR